MCCYRCTHRQCLFLVSILFILECIFNTVYYKDITAVYKREKIHHSNLSEMKNKSEDKFQQLMEFCCKFTISISAAQDIGKKQIIDNSTLQGVTKKRIVVNYKYPLNNSTSVSMEFYHNILARGSSSRDVISKTDNSVNHETIHYKYELTNGTVVEMDYDNGYNSSYDWFMRMKFQFKHFGDKEKGGYPNGTPMCKLNETSLGQIKVIKNETNLKWVEEQNPDVKPGGYYAPTHCRSEHRVAIIVPYRDRRVNLGIFLRYIHPLLKKQLLEYRIFVIEQYGTEKFNKGTLYNIAFLESQRFGKWNCLIFHDVDLVPEDERISYSCSDHPTHMAAAVESFGYVVPYRLIFGGVTALTPQDYKTVNGYSNLYWNWGAEDDDFYARLEAHNLLVLRYDRSIARYATLPHTYPAIGNERGLLLMLAKIRCRKEGLATTKYKLLEVTEEKLYTHILADVNPTKMKLNMKSVMQRAFRIHGETILYGRREFTLANPSKL